MKKIYERPETRVLNIEAEALMALSGYNVDNSHGGQVYGNMKGPVLEDDWDEGKWGMND